MPTRRSAPRAQARQAAPGERLLPAREAGLMSIQDSDQDGRRDRDGRGESSSAPAAAIGGTASSARATLAATVPAGLSTTLATADPSAAVVVMAPTVAVSGQGGRASARVAPAATPYHRYDHVVAAL